MEVVRPPGPLFVLEYRVVSIAGAGRLQHPKPQADAGSWAVLAAKRALVLPALQIG